MNQAKTQEGPGQDEQQDQELHTWELVIMTSDGIRHVKTLDDSCPIVTLQKGDVAIDLMMAATFGSTMMLTAVDDAYVKHVQHHTLHGPAEQWIPGIKDDNERF